MQKPPGRRHGTNGPQQRGRPQATPPTDKPGIKNPYLRFRPLKKPPVSLHATTLWDFPSQHYGRGEQGSQHYRGATPSHIIWNLVARHTKEGDLVVDPFCGSGTTIDVCKDLGRRAKGFDIAPSRIDIVRHDARHLSEVVERESVHLAFFDPPYADNLTYSDDPACIGKLAWAGGAWTQAMADVLDELMTIVKPGGIVAGFVSDVLHVSKKVDRQGGREHKTVDRSFQPLGIELWNLAVARGFIPVDHVAVIRRGKALDDPRLRARAEDENFLLRGFSHLVIFERPQHAPPRSKKASAPKSAAPAPAAPAAPPSKPRSSSSSSSSSSRSSSSSSSSSSRNKKPYPRRR